MRFLVTLHREVTQTMDVEVHATSRVQAVERAKASERAGRGEWVDLDLLAPDAVHVTNVVDLDKQAGGTP